VCTLAVKKKSGQVSTCRIGPFPCKNWIELTKLIVLVHRQLLVLNVRWGICPGRYFCNQVTFRPSDWELNDTNSKLASHYPRGQLKSVTVWDTVVCMYVCMYIGLWRIYRYSRWSSTLCAFSLLSLVKPALWDHLVYVARQRLGKHLRNTLATIEELLGRVVVCAVRVVTKESRWLLTPRTSCILCHRKCSSWRKKCWILFIIIFFISPISSPKDKRPLPSSRASSVRLMGWANLQ
jgi:hypothetical protein